MGNQQRGQQQNIRGGRGGGMRHPNARGGNMNQQMRGSYGNQ